MWPTQLHLVIFSRIFILFSSLVKSVLVMRGEKDIFWPTTGGEYNLNDSFRSEHQDLFLSINISSLNSCIHVRGLCPWLRAAGQRGEQTCDLHVIPNARSKQQIISTSVWRFVSDLNHFFIGGLASLCAKVLLYHL